MTPTNQKNNHSPAVESRIDRAEIREIMKELLKDKDFIIEISGILKSGGGEKEIMEVVKKRKKKVDDLTLSMFGQ
jgi:hypothetical protein